MSMYFEEFQLEAGEGDSTVTENSRIMFSLYRLSATIVRMIASNGIDFNCLMCFVYAMKGGANFGVVACLF